MSYRAKALGCRHLNLCGPGSEFTPDWGASQDPCGRAQETTPLHLNVLWSLGVCWEVSRLMGRELLVIPCDSVGASASAGSL